MDIWNSLKAIVVAISIAITALFGVSGGQEVAVPQASSTIQTVDAAVAQQSASSSESSTIVQAYELGKSIGRLQQQVESIKQVVTTSSGSVGAGTPPSNEVPTPPIVNQPQTTTMTPQPSKASITVISPIPGKGLGRKYTAQNEIVDESNYIELGLVVRDDNENPVKDAEVKITATDSSQNKDLNGTGNITKIYKDGIPETVPYYPFHYEFRTTGLHTITFECNGKGETVTVEVAEPTPL